MPLPVTLACYYEARTNVDIKPLPDVVGTQGRHLVARPNTPIYSKPFDPEFVYLLKSGLERLDLRHSIRSHKYGQAAADEWPAGHTPIELREEYSIRSKAQVAAFYEACRESDSDYSEVEETHSIRSTKPITPPKSFSEKRKHLLATPSPSELDTPFSKPSTASSHTSHSQLEPLISPEITSKATRGKKRRHSETDDSESRHVRNRMEVNDSSPPIVFQAVPEPRRKKVAGFRMECRTPLLRSITKSTVNAEPVYSVVPPHVGAEQVQQLLGPWHFYCIEGRGW